jgi:hypothetical protein
MDTTTVIVTAISAAAVVAAVAIVVALLRKRVTRFKNKGTNLDITAAPPAKHELQTKSAKIDGRSTVEPMKGTSMDLGKLSVTDESVLRVREAGEPFADGTGGK